MIVVDPKPGGAGPAGAPRAPAEARPGSRARRPVPAGAILVCIERSSEGAALRDAGVALARVLACPIALVQVLETASQPGQLPDPLVSAVRRREARAALDQLAAAGEDAASVAAVAVLEGSPARELRRIAAETGSRALVIGRNRQGGELSLLGTTTREILEYLPASLFLLPPEAEPPYLPDATRPILVPLDGSEWAELALPVVAAVARATGAPIRIVHVLEPVRAALPMPPRKADLALGQKMSEHAHRLWTAYLERVAQTLAADGCRVEQRLLAEAEPRLALSRHAEREPCGMVILSARGQSRSHLLDLPVGSVASYLAARVGVAMLVVKTNGLPLLRPEDGAAQPQGIPRRPA